MKRSKFQILQIKDLKRVIRDLFINREEIQLAYLYGSYAKGIQTEYSDIDIGVILKEGFIEPPLYFADLSINIEKCFNYKINVDLRIINNATPRFLFHLIKNGKILFEKNRTFTHEFELKVLSMYQEIKPMLDMYDKISIREVLEDGHRS